MKFLLFATISLTASNAFGQQSVNIMSNFDKSTSNQSTSLHGGRWEFFMSEVAVKLTFKIDKFTGDVFQLVEIGDGLYTWELVEKQNSDKDIQKQDVINYQLFSSGKGIRHTYLINTNSGLTWQLVQGEDGDLLFQEILEQDMILEYLKMIEKVIIDESKGKKKK